MNTLPKGLAYASHLDGRHNHPPVRSEHIVHFYCNCLICCEERKGLRRSNGWTWPHPDGFIAVKVSS